VRLKIRMSYLELYTSPAATFGGAQLPFSEADYIVVGVPLDVTSSFRPGSRFAPLAVRQASLNMESYSFISKVDLEDLRIHDAGDLHVSGDIQETLKRLRLITEEIAGKGKIPIFIGGEHTLTLGATKGFHEDMTVLCFDAHLDLRNEYLNQSVCHGTVMRRISELGNVSSIVEVGTRAACKEELKYAKDRGINYVTSHQVFKNGIEDTAKKVNDFIAKSDRIYLTFDMDVLDPAYAPAVQTPEPLGLSTFDILELLSKTCSKRLIGFDVVEVTPQYDNGLTSLQAAKIIFEVLSYIHKDKAKI
jgi:agmatinase